MNGVKVFLILSVLFIVTYISFSNVKKKNTLNIKQKANILQDALVLIYAKGDSSGLFIAYDMLVEEDGYEECILNPFLLKNGITVLTLLKKYEKLDCILRNVSNKLENNTREDFIDGNEYLRYRVIDSVRAKKAIERVILRLEERLGLNPNDSISEYRIMMNKVYIYGKEKVLKQIDSLEHLNSRRHSITYYEYLKNSIENMPSVLEQENNDNKHHLETKKAYSLQSDSNKFGSPDIEVIE